LPGRSKDEKYNNIKRKKKEVSIDELCLNQPVEFKEFMQYCRSLKFTDDPDYRYILNLFDNCMDRNNFDPKTPDFIWNKNRLVLEKEALKQNMMRALQKPTTKKAGAGEVEEDQGKQQNWARWEPRCVIEDCSPTELWNMCAKQHRIKKPPDDWLWTMACKYILLQLLIMNIK